MRRVLVIEMNDDRYHSTPEIKAAFEQAVQDFQEFVETEVFTYFDSPDEYDFHDENTNRKADAMQRIPRHRLTVNTEVAYINGEVVGRVYKDRRSFRAQDLNGVGVQRQSGANRGAYLFDSEREAVRAIGEAAGIIGKYDYII